MSKTQQVKFTVRRIYNHLNSKCASFINSQRVKYAMCNKNL